MKYTLKTKENSKAEIEVNVTAETFNKYVDAAYKKDKGKFNIAGFRKGKVPKAIIEKQYGKGVFLRLHLIY